MERDSDQPPWPFPERAEPPRPKRAPAPQPPYAEAVQIEWEGLLAWLGCSCDSCRRLLHERRRARRDE